MTDQQKLFCAVTEFDRRASRRKGYNPHALGHYARALGNIRQAVEAGRPIREAIVCATLDRLRDACLKSIGEAPAEPFEELRYSATRKFLEALE